MTKLRTESIQNVVSCQKSSRSSHACGESKVNHPDEQGYGCLQWDSLSFQPQQYHKIHQNSSNTFQKRRCWLPRDENWRHGFPVEDKHQWCIQAYISYIDVLAHKIHKYIDIYIYVYIYIYIDVYCTLLF